MESILLPSAGYRRRNGDAAPLPVVGEIYNYYDDDKIRCTRQCKALVTKIVPFDEVDDSVKKKWEEDVKEHDWAYADKTDFFIFLELDCGDGKVDAKDYDGNPIPIVAVRNVNGEWSTWDFYWSGLLDVDGEMTEYLKGVCAREGYEYFELIPKEKAMETFNNKDLK